MKYIIEIKPEYEDSFKGLIILGAKDSDYFVDTLMVDDLEVLNSDYINEHFSDLQDTAYKKGLHDGESKCRYCNEYQRGLDDAWEAARKIVLDEGIDMDTLCTIFRRGCSDSIIKDYSAAEVIEKLQAYEEKQKAEDEINVGDTVNLKDGSRDNDGIVTKSWDNDRHFIMWADGSGGVWDKEYIVKTGRHFDISSILEAMRE